MLTPITLPGNSPIVPTIDVQFFKASMQDGVAQRLAEIVLQEKDHILETTPVPKGMSPTWLTGRFWSYNLLDYDHEELRYLKTFIAEQYGNFMQSLDLPVTPVYIKVWANLLRFKQEITWHNHFDCVTGLDTMDAVFPHISGNICVKTHGTKTWFRSPFLGGAGADSFGNGKGKGSSRFKQDVIGIDNVVGECLFFPSWVIHRTDENETTEPRITISFDIIPESVYLVKQDNAIFRRLI
jgi:hypothetical protein